MAAERTQPGGIDEAQLLGAAHARKIAPDPLPRAGRIQSRDVYPRGLFRCPCCGITTDHQECGNLPRKHLRRFICGCCSSRLLVGPIARREVSDAGVPYVVALEFFCREDPYLSGTPVVDAGPNEA